MQKTISLETSLALPGARNRRATEAVNVRPHEQALERARTPALYLPACFHRA